MSSDPSELGPFSTPEDVERALTRLAARVDELEDELQEERQRRQALEERIGPLEYRPPDEDVEGPEHLPQYWLGDWPLGAYLKGRASNVEFEETQEDLHELWDRVDDLANGAVEKEPDENQALPIQQVRHSQKVGNSRLSANERRAAIIWGAFFDEATSTATKHVLDSSTVRTILRQHEDGRPHDETVRRTMELVADLGREYVEREKRDGQHVLVIERGPWEEFVAGFYDGEADG